MLKIVGKNGMPQSPGTEHQNNHRGCPKLRAIPSSIHVKQTSDPLQCVDPAVCHWAPATQHQHEQNKMTGSSCKRHSERCKAMITLPSLVTQRRTIKNRNQIRMINNHCFDSCNYPSSIICLYLAHYSHKEHQLEALQGLRQDASLWQSLCMLRHDR